MTMKRLMLVCLLILCLLPVSVWAEENVDALYPIREGDLWGYMNQAGELVIKPQWITAEAFSDGWAIVESDEGSGLIDACGMYVIQPSDCIRIEEYAYAYTVYDYNLEGYGFFDKASGYYQAPLADYEMIILWGEDGKGPIAVRNTDYLTGYVSRTTGETVIPFRYTGESEDAAFNEGYALAANQAWLDENDIWHEVLPDSEPMPDNMDEIRGWRCRYYLIDTTGKEVRFPDGLEPYTGICQGVLVVHPDPFVQWEMPEDQEEDIKPEAGDSDFFDSFGIAKPDGTVILEPQLLYYLWQPDSEGMLCYVGSSWGDCGHMNLNGEVIVPAKYRITTGGPIPYYTFVNGYAVIIDDIRPETRIVLLAKDGREVVSLPYRDGERFRKLLNVMSNGLVWSCTSGPDSIKRYRLFRVAENELIPLPENTWEDVDTDGFAESVQAVCRNTLWGYINEQAQWVIPPQYDSAAGFRDGLALVEQDGKLSYINHDGTVVWEEQWP